MEARGTRTCAPGRCSGFSLLEVLVGIVIFALGMMALAQLQGNLGKSSGDSNARSVASNLAEEEVEAARTFSQVTAGVGANAFNNIVSGTKTVQRGGINYTVTSVVTDYYYNPGTGAFQTSKPNANIVNADMKLLQLTVAWGTGSGAMSFQIDESNSTTALGTGSITLTDAISSITSPSGGKVVLNSTTNDLYGPPVDYTPGDNPDIISIELGENRFKESTTPLPDVVRADELVETTFDVVTYSQSDSGATFLRREEFRALSCECTLRLPGADTEGGLRPTRWNGNDYTEGEFVSKAYGESANNQQSGFCSLCCRDHHDGGSGEQDDGSDPGRSLYDPFKSDAEYWTADDAGPSELLGDHKHYRRSNTGDLTLVDSDGETYMEACRLIRKDGFFRVAQDLRQEGLNSFPADYLDDAGEVEEYSDYVTGAVAAYTAAAEGGYEQAPPGLMSPEEMSPAMAFPASTYEAPSTMNVDGRREQQLRSRGIYIDYLSDEVRTIVECMEDGGTGSDCGVVGSNTALEVIPFYDVQLTWLSRWNETPNNYPIDVTNEAIADSNTHSRGIAELTDGYGVSTISAAVHRGNLGLTGTDPIDPRYAYDLRSYNLYAEAVGAADPPPTGGYLVSGTITSSVSGVKAADAEITADDASCDRTNTGFECIVSPVSNNPRLTIHSYFKRNFTLVACSAAMGTNGTSHSGSTASANWTRFDLPRTYTSSADIVIKADACN